MVMLQINRKVMEPLMLGGSFKAGNGQFTGAMDSIKGEGLKVFTGAHATYHGSGWWAIVAYAYDKNDLHRFMRALL